MNKLNLICMDFETSGLSATRHAAIEIAAKAYDCNFQEFSVSEGGEFGPILMKPLPTDEIDDNALRVNHITRQQLEKAASQEAVWLQFITWVKRYNVGTTKYTTPICMGKNIRNFDLLFVDELNRRHSPKKEKTILFNQKQQIDLEDLIFMWFEHDPDLPDMKMDTLRPYFGLSSDGAHSAMVDVRQTSELIIKFLKLHRSLRAKKLADGTDFIKFRNSCRGV